ncbi:MAG TPA: hypothetical protein VIK97_14005 [Casimicrobiaceae bacterium]
MLATAETLSRYDEPGSLKASTRSPKTVAPVLAGFDMLQRGIDSAIDRPDQRYWTTYDYFMIEREARAARTTHITALCTKGVAVLRKWFA